MPHSGAEMNQPGAPTLVTGTEAAMVIQDKSGLILAGNAVAKAIFGDNLAVGAEVGAGFLLNAVRDELTPEEYPAFKTFVTGVPVVNMLVGYRAPNANIRWFRATTSVLETATAGGAIQVLTSYVPAEHADLSVASEEPVLATGRAPSVTPRTASPAGAAMSAQSTAEKQIVDRRLSAALEAAELRLWEIDRQRDLLVFDEGSKDRHALAGEGVDAVVPMATLTSIMHPEDRERALSEFDAVLEHGGKCTSLWRVQPAPSVMRYLEHRFWREYAEDGTPRLVGITRDVTEETEVRKRLEDKTREAESASTAKSEFLARMSHEIRTPMNGIIGMLEVLLRAELKPDQRDHADTALKSARNLMHVLDDVIDISQLETRQLTIHAAAFAPRQLVKDVVSLFETLAAERGLSLNATIDPKTPGFVSADSRRVRQVLTNLVGNALKFTLNGGIEISVGYDRELERLRIQVKDTGIGLPEHAMSQVFTPFYQVDPSSTRRQDGSGLGLAVCKHLAELMGGELGVESRLGEGCTFWVDLPAPLTDSITSVSEQIDDAPNRDLRILAAEDNPAMQKILKALLSGLGHELKVVPNGQSAVAEAASGSYDVILMDIMMPIMDGPTATSRIRELGGRAGSIPIIALTANALAGDRDRYIAAGMTDYLAKPLDVSALLAALARAERALM